MATLIYETVHGSTAYGLAREGSDVDLKGIVVGPAIWYHGYRPGPEQVEVSADHVRYDIRKFFRLAVAANPTIIEVLWTDPQHHRVVEPAGRRLLDHRSAFLSRRVEGSFGKYAMSQLKRIRSHRAWLLEPPERAPTRGEFGLPEHAVIGRDQLGAAEALLEQGAIGEAELTPNFLALMDRERRYRAARTHWNQYQGWLRDRNPARAALEARFGYDTKHALHLVRLLRMALEILEIGTVSVLRGDRDELWAIRDGAWSYDRLVGYAEDLDARVAEAAGRSSLPAEPDRDALNELCADLVEEVLRVRS